MARQQLRSTIAKPRRRCHQAVPTCDSSSSTLLHRPLHLHLHRVRSFSHSRSPIFPSASPLTVSTSPNVAATATTTLLPANVPPICPNVSSGALHGLIDDNSASPSIIVSATGRPMETSTISEPPLPAGKKEKEKRFQCPHCQRMFARLEHLQRHERIHSGIKPFSCAECNYSFTRR